jgi:2-oxoglutarate ferredoxin oxidoreductase subunit beta
MTARRRDAASRAAAPKPAPAPQPPDLKTGASNTWCPGCGNFAVLNALRATLLGLIGEGTPREDIVVVADIGCNGKIMDYIGVNSFNALHGRAVASAVGIKLANPRLKVIVHAGDGATFAEGLEHVLYAAKRNVDISLIVHDNGVYGLTIGQAGPETPPGYRGRSTPYGSVEEPFNPLDLLYAAGATSISRGYTHGIPLLKRLYREAIAHRGFAVVDTLQVCVTFRNMYEAYNARVYELDGHDPRDEAQALAKLREWDYRSDGPIALGTLSVRERPVFGEQFEEYGRGPLDLEARLAEAFTGLT